MIDELLNRLREDARMMRLTPKTVFRRDIEPLPTAKRKTLRTPRTCGHVAEDIEKLIQLWERK